MTDRTELRRAEREALYAPDRRLNAYYFSFDSTGSPIIDAILSAVAYAGKSYHHTESWARGSRWDEGRSYVDVIQAAANEAANKLTDADALRAELAHMTEARDNARAEVERLTTQVTEVREAHSAASADMQYCIGCDAESSTYDTPWPCPTIRALGGERS